MSYVKARAEGAGLSADGGLAERAERLIARAGRRRRLLAGLGVPFALDIALWLLAAASVVTVVQRLRGGAARPATGPATTPPNGHSGERA